MRYPGLLPKSSRNFLQSSQGKSSRPITPLISMQRLSPPRIAPRLASWSAPCGRGTIYEDMYITTPPTGGSCGFSFTKGEEYIVYAYDSAYADGSSYTVSMCSRSALLGQAQVDIDALGAGRAPQAGTGSATPSRDGQCYSSRDGQCYSSRDERGSSSRDGRTVARTATEYGCEYGMGDRPGGNGGGPRNKRGCGLRTCEASVGHALRSPSTGGRISRPSAINAAPLP